MNKVDAMVSIVSILILLGILMMPAYIQNEKSGAIELAMEEHENIQLVQTTDFMFSFSIKNYKAEPAYVTYDFIKDGKTIDSDNVLIVPGEKKVLSYPITMGDERKAHSYLINLHQASQSIGFWTLPNSTYLRDLESGPYYDRDVPWDLVDPLTQEYYRRG